MALTRITKGVIKPNENYDTHDINSTGIITATALDISGNASIGGVLTYEDVTSIDSVGIITAQNGIDCNADLDVDGHTNLDNVSVAGVSTFSGVINATGGLVGNATKITLTSSTANSSLPVLFSTGVIGSSGADTLINSSKLTFNPSSGTLGVNGNLSIAEKIIHTGDTNCFISFPAADQIVFEGGGHERFRINGTTGKYLFGRDITGRTAHYNNTGVVPTIQIEDDTEASFSVAKFSNNTDSSRIYLQKGRGSTGSAAKVQDGDTLGMIVFNGYNGSGFRNAAQITAEVDGDPATGNLSTDMPGALVFKTSADQTNVPAERLRIDSSGRVYIGATSGGNPDTDDLVISGSGKKGITLCSTDGSESRLTFADGLSGVSAVAGSVLYTHSNNSLDFYTATARRLRISGSGPHLFLGGTTSVNEITEGSTHSGLVIGNTSMGNGGLAIINSTSGTGRIYFGDDVGGNAARNRGQINYYHNGDYMLFATAGSERLRITSDGGTLINKGGTVNSASGWAGLEVKAGSSEHQLVLSSTATASNSNQVRLGFKLHPSNDNERVKAAIICQGSGGGYGEPSRMMFCLDSVGDNGSATPNSVDEKLRIMSTGELIIYPTTGGNQNTSIHFNNNASTPYITFRTNNVSEAAHISAGENNGGCDLTFKTKNQSGTSLDRLTVKNNGGLYTHQLAGNEKGYPIIMATDTVANNTQMSGSFNYHDFMCASTAGGNNYQIGGWVYLGNDYGPNPYPVRRFQIAKPGGFSNGTIVYQVWHNGDANYLHGGLWEIRINCWTGSSRFESVGIRCVNGSRDDMRVVAYNNSNGIMIQPSSIWGQVFIRKAGWDDGGRNPGSSYCAVANNGALAIYNNSGTDDGTMPTSGSPVDVYSFDGTSGSASATHTGGYYIENGSYFDG